MHERDTAALAFAIWFDDDRQAEALRVFPCLFRASIRTDDFAPATGMEGLTDGSWIAEFFQKEGGVVFILGDFG